MRASCKAAFSSRPSEKQGCLRPALRLIAESDPVPQDAIGRQPDCVADALGFEELVHLGDWRKRVAVKIETFHHAPMRAITSFIGAVRTLPDRRPDEILDIEIVPGDNGVELRLWIAEARIDAFTEHRRYMAGPTGCGLCGVESLAEAMRPPPKVTSGFRMAADAVADAVAALPALQPLNRETRAIHAAAF
jgi:FdhD/NarQ family